jgi:hypothetical protein
VRARSLRGSEAEIMTMHEVKVVSRLPRTARPVR